MKNRFIQTVDNFTSEAQALRKTFDKNFNDPLHGTSERFVWDYWHIPDQYTLLRTPASRYFAKNDFANFMQSLTNWGQNTLGCLSTSPPWLSCYVEGCEQKLHCDIPHGPWAFVFSLTAKKKFSGGETLIFKPEHLNYWDQFSSARGFEQEDLFFSITPKFNRLIVFDPRLPHGVTRVQGTQDPRNARLVIHGWFTQPQPIVRGPISTREVQNHLNDLLQSLGGVLQEISPVTGMQSYKLNITPNGRVTSATLLSNTLVSREGRNDHIRALTKWLELQLQEMQFKKCKSSSNITLPLIFD